MSVIGIVLLIYHRNVKMDIKEVELMSVELIQLDIHTRR
jgi:hypothetical protein